MGTVVELPVRAAATDTALVEAALAGDMRAREALFRRHARSATGLALRLLGRDNEVDDVVQDAYVIALDRLHTLLDPEAFGGFLAGILVHRVRRVLRRRRIARRIGLLPAAEPLDVSAFVSRSAPAEVIAELTAVYAIVEQLPTDERVALLLRRVEGLPLEEVARVVGCSLATVKRKISAAEATLERSYGAPVSKRGRRERGAS
ncbi:MAG TPA: RNA polymerase sigma factor [Byssovorax sp.]|jgi:RNA polymerase sigma-70 factor (ECF subfamily)